MVKFFRLLHQKPALFFNKAFINGQWVDSKTKKTFLVTNPTNNEPLGTVPDMISDDLQTAIQAAVDAQQTWQSTTPKERSHFLRRWYDLMVENHENLAKIITLESGKPLLESRAEVCYGSSFVEFFSEESRRINGEIIQSPNLAKKILVEKHPIGVVGLITPWNFPHALITRKASAALAAGCCCVIKPAEDTPYSALALMALAEEAEIPRGVVNTVTCSRANIVDIGNCLCQSNLVAGLSFTGSINVGKVLYKQCSSRIKRLGLELGGNAPFIVFPSANLNKAVKAAIQSKFRCCGQTCIAPNRFFIHSAIYNNFVTKLCQEMTNNLQMGLNLGPLINQNQFDKVSNLVQDAVCKGAIVLKGGQAAPDYGPFFYQPTVLANITQDMKIYQEEVFGPVIGLMKFDLENDSVRMANDSETGLAAYIFSEDVAQIFRVTRKLQVGMCGVNEGSISMAEVPFGGIKESGLGREGSHYGIDDFVYIKYVCIGNL